VVRVAFDVADLTIAQVHANAAATGAHVAGGLFDLGLANLGIVLHCRVFHGRLIRLASRECPDILIFAPRLWVSIVAENNVLLIEVMPSGRRPAATAAGHQDNRRHGKLAPDRTKDLSLVNGLRENRDALIDISAEHDADTDTDSSANA
jgi:hypothetical protein